MTITIYGIPNCATVKKAREWLAREGIDARFHDYRKSGIDREHLVAWCREFGWEKVLNRAGTTFRGLTAAQKDGLTEARAITLMAELPSLIKRPVLDIDGRLLLGFSPGAYAAAFGRG